MPLQVIEDYYYSISNAVEGVLLNQIDFGQNPTEQSLKDNFNDLNNTLSDIKYSSNNFNVIHVSLYNPEQLAPFLKENVEYQISDIFDCALSYINYQILDQLNPQNESEYTELKKLGWDFGELYNNLVTNASSENTILGTAYKGEDFLVQNSNIEDDFKTAAIAQLTDLGVKLDKAYNIVESKNFNNTTMKLILEKIESERNRSVEEIIDEVISQNENQANNDLSLDEQMQIAITLSLQDNPGNAAPANPQPFNDAHDNPENLLNLEALEEENNNRGYFYGFFSSIFSGATYAVKSPFIFTYNISTYVLSNIFSIFTN
ncbi:MAG: hypothetical protein DGJ47_000326 [Rickettsiaceae bacterium]